jgi:Inverse autotransporter, beta-domain
MLLCLSALSGTPSTASQYHSLPGSAQDQKLLQDLASASVKPKRTPSPPHPERYIDSTVKYGLKMVLPQTIRRGLNFDAGYDRWAGLPTMQADYFLPVKGWKDKSIFFSPRVSLTGTKESFSIGGGFRHLITSETLVGFHAFHDWMRPRRLRGDFLKEAGVGVEFAALPGRYSDLSLAFNAYFPINARQTVARRGNSLVRESFATGYDARVDFLLPVLIDSLDIRMEGQLHSYTGDQTDMRGYKAGLSVKTRDGMWSAGFETGADDRRGSNYKMEGSINLAFDWTELLKGNNPFSAPYKAPTIRFSRKIRDSLYDRVRRKHDLPTERTESRVTLVANVTDDELKFSGAFPGLSNALVTLQTSQSPWQDHREVVTDSAGRYSGELELPPGTYRIRLIHKPTGRVSAVKTVKIGTPGKDQLSAEMR